MFSYLHDLEEKSQWIIVKSNQIPWCTQPETELPYIQELGDFYARPNFFTERTDLKSYLIKYTLSGGGILEYGGQTYRIRAGDCFWIDCDDYQKYYTDPEIGSWHVIWLHFYGNHCHDYYRLFTERNPSPVFRLPPSYDFEQLYTEMVEHHKSNPVDPDLRSTGELVRLMLNAISVGVDNTDSKVPGYINEAKKYIAEHYTEDISVDDLCRILNLSKHYFIRRFKQFTHSTPHRYLIMYRLHEAKTLLRTTDMTIADIAQRVGCEHIGNFTNIFKQYEGMTPSRYRTDWRS